MSLNFCLTFAGETHGNNICEDIGKVQIISVNLGDIVNFFFNTNFNYLKPSFIFTDSLSDTFHHISVLQIYPEQSHKPEEKIMKVARIKTTLS